MALSPIQNRPLVKPQVPVAPRAQAPAPVRTTAAAPAVQEGAKPAFTPPLIWDLVLAGGRMALAPVQAMWSFVPSTIRNARDVTNGHISVARGAGNVVSDGTIGLTKFAVAGASVQALQVIVAPWLGVVPPNLMLPVSLLVGVGGLIGSYMVTGKLVKWTGVDKKLANGVTNLLGGDKPAAEAPAAEEKPAAKPAAAKKST